MNPGMLAVCVYIVLLAAIALLAVMKAIDRKRSRACVPEESRSHVTSNAIAGLRHATSFLFATRLRTSGVVLAVLLLTGAVVHADFRLPNISRSLTELDFRRRIAQPAISI